MTELALILTSGLLGLAFAAYLAVVRPGQLVNLFIAAFTTYLVTTAWFAARDRDGESGLGGKIALLVAIFELHRGLLPPETVGAIVQGHLKTLLPFYAAKPPAAGS